MTNRCKFGSGNGVLARIARSTVGGVIRWPKLLTMQVCRLQRKRTQCSTERSGREGRAGRHYAKASMMPSSLVTSAHTDGITSPVSRWWHADKAIGSNLGDRMMRVPTIRVRTAAAVLISTSEMVQQHASCGVGEVHSIDDAEDNITSEERRGLTWCMPVLKLGRSPFHSPSLESGRR